MHQGECEALSLAREINARILLVDERKAFRQAIIRNMNAIGTLKVLELAAEEKLIDLRRAFGNLKQNGFWVSDSLLEERLRLFELREG